MPTPYEPLQPIEIPNDNNSLFTAVTFSMLLPVLINTDAFEDAFERLFGDINMRGKRTTLKQELNHLRANAVPASLPMLINDHLRPKLAAYCLVHTMDRVDHEDDVELNTLSAMIEIAIERHENSNSATDTPPISAHPERGQSIHLLMTNGYLQPLIDARALSSVLRSQLFPVQDVVVLATPHAFAPNPASFKCPSFEGMLRVGLMDTSNKLALLAKNRPAVLGLLSEEMILVPGAYPADRTSLHELPLRLNDLEKEINAVTLNLNRVNLDGALNANFPEVWKHPILDGARNGALAGVGVATALTLLTELELGFGVGSLFLIEALPLAVAITLVGAGIGLIGGPYAAEYGQALVIARGYLDAGDYVNAAHVLDEQFNYPKLVRWTRSWFLTHEHNAVSHFFRAACAEKMREFNIAYMEYELARGSALRADRKLTVFLSKLHKIGVLKKARQDELPSGVDREKMLDTTLLELTREYETGFSDLYCKIHDNVMNLVRCCLGNRRLSQSEIETANKFLEFDGFFMLKHVSHGRGEFLALFSLFFQGAMIAFFHHNEPRYLNDEVRDRLVTSLCGVILPENDVLLTLASQKMQQALELLILFKQSNAANIQRDESIQSGMVCMENFIIHFYAHCAGKDRAFKDLYKDVIEKLSIAPRRGALILQYTQFSIELLNTLQRDFGRRFLSIDAWLDELLSPNSPLKTAVSKVTGDSMLHLLTRLPLTDDPQRLLRTKKAARHLKELCYVRNYNHETPMSALQAIDVYPLKPSIFPGLMIEIGNELEKVDKFLEAVKRDPAKSKHFLLLEGPPGTGKSDTVLEYLKAQRHIIYEWHTGEENDRYVGGLATRVQNFFNIAKCAAQGSPNTWHLLFIDEIDAICPQSEGAVATGSHNRQEIVTLFQKENEALRGINNVVLVGTTNFPERIASAMLSRADRILFSLPDITAREKLLHHFFREKRIDPKNISRMANLTSGWSARPLLSIATSIESHEVSDGNLNKAFTDSSLLFESDFRKNFPHAHVSLPIFSQTQADDPLSSLSVLSDETREQFMRLAASLNNPSHYSGSRLHALLYGPPGGGKTTAVRTFAKSCNFTFILVEAGVSLQEMHGLFDRAKTFNPSIIFIDEIDQITCDESPFREFLQEQMDGFFKNNIVVIGATNYPGKIAAPLVSRFLLKIFVPPFSPKQRGELFESLLRKELDNKPTFQLDETFCAELQNSCLKLGEASARLSVRDIKNLIVIFFGDLRVQHERNPGSSLRITLSQLLMRINPSSIESTSVGENRESLFSISSSRAGSSLQSSVISSANTYGPKCAP